MTTPSASPKPITGTLASSSTFLNGLPFTAIAPTGTPPGLGNWIFTANNSDIAKIAASLQNVVTSGANNYQHLNPGVINDVFMVFHYSAK